MILPTKASSFIVCFTAYIEQRMVTKTMYIFLRNFEMQREGLSPYSDRNLFDNQEIVELQPSHSCLPARAVGKTNMASEIVIFSPVLLHIHLMSVDQISISEPALMRCSA